MHVLPKPTPPTRMQPLAVLPVFLALDGKRVVIAGEADAVCWKAELAAAAGAAVRVYASGGWQPEDLCGAALAIGALAGEEAARFAVAAKARGVPVNIVDDPSLGTFTFGAIVNRSPLVAGISSGGGRLGRAGRRRPRRSRAPRAARAQGAADGRRHFI